MHRNAAEESKGTNALHARTFRNSTRANFYITKSALHVTQIVQMSLQM